MRIAPASAWREEDRRAVACAQDLWSALPLRLPLALKVVLDHLGLQLELVRFPAGVRGVFLPEVNTIRVNAVLPRWQQRYVIAHEIGHALACRGALVARPHRLERVCQLFAAALLMPPDRLRQAAERLHGRAEMVEELMAVFQVSREALCIQLRRLRLLPGEASPGATAEEDVARLAPFDALLAADLAPLSLPVMEIDVDAIYRARGAGNDESGTPSCHPAHSGVQ